jgi:5-methylcytosine-specific restriction protein A
MTRRALKPCAGSPLCPELVEGRYCQAHDRDRERARGSAAARGYDAEWTKTRFRYLDTLRKASPDGLARCEECGIPERPKSGPLRPTLSLHVDHIDGLGPNGPRGHDFDNLQALCQPCHGTKTALQTGTAGGPR